MGFWIGNKRKYYTRRKLKIMIKRKLMRFNYDHNMDITKYLAEYNDYLVTQIKLYASDNITLFTKSNSFNITQEDFEEYFNDSNDILNLKELQPVFMLYIFGIVLSLIVFCVELLCFRLKHKLLIWY